MAASCLTAVLVLGLLGGALGKVGFGDGGQEYGYVDVRTGAHMFYWLFYVNGGESAAGKPLVIWFQGGPGASSSSYGNFEEIGPLNAFLEKRNSTWVNHVNVLFIDNPVGTGYSYVDNNGLLTTTNQQIAEDLVAFTKSFMTMYPAFQKLPLYIFCESYGGKMTAEFALNLYKEQTAGRVASNLKGIALGDSWISPIDSVMTWAPYLLHTGMVDKQGYDKIMDSAIATKNAVDRGLWSDATSLWSRTEYVIMDVAADVDFYNILTPISSYWRSGRDNSKGKGIEDRFLRTMVGRDSGVDLNSLMDRYVKPALGVIPANVKHTFSSSTVFNTLRGDFMKPVTNVVEQLLNDTDIEVNVLTGQLDLIVDTPGTLMWAEQLHWKLGDFWVNQVPRELLVVDGIIEGYVKGTSKFIFYWVNRAGHMIPSDNPAATIEILKRVTRLK